MEKERSVDFSEYKYNQMKTLIKSYDLCIIIVRERM